jgi:hypothetical protein
MISNDFKNGVIDQNNYDELLEDLQNEIQEAYIERTRPRSHNSRFASCSAVSTKVAHSFVLSTYLAPSPPRAGSHCAQSLRKIVQRLVTPYRWKA